MDVTVIRPSEGTGGYSGGYECYSRCAFMGTASCPYGVGLGDNTVGAARRRRLPVKLVLLSVMASVVFVNVLHATGWVRADIAPVGELLRRL